MAELPGPVCRSDDCAHHRAAQSAFFQCQNTLNGGTAGAGDLVLERARMQSRFQNHPRSTKHGLGGQLRRHIAWQANGHPTVAQRLDELIHVSRPASTEPSDTIQQRLLDLEDQADGGKKFLRQGRIGRRRRPAHGERAGRGAHERRGVGHDTHHAGTLAQRPLQAGQRHAGGDGDQQVVGRKVAADFRQYTGDLGRLDRQDQDVGGLDDFQVLDRSPGADLGGKRGQRRFREVAGDDLVRREQLGADETLGNGGGHFAGTEKTERE